MLEEATIRARIHTREGAPYDPEQVSSDVRSIYELGSVENVTVDAESFEGGIRLTYALAERPLLKTLEFEGNKELKTDDLREKAALTLNTAYNPVAVAEAVTRLRALYREKGYYNALVRTRTEPAGEGQVRLFVVIEEGETYKLVKIRFTGAKAFTEEELRKQMKTGEWWIFSWMGSSGKLQQELLQEDRQRIVTHYQDNGYLEVRVGEPDVKVDDKKRTLEVVVPITEGLQYRLGKTTLQGDDLVPLEEIRRLVGLNEGDIFRRSAFAKGLFEVNQRYASRGYAFVKLDYGTKLDPAQRTIDVTFLVERGAEARFGRINIVGNVTTRDKVIRRELTFSEGDLFNSDALRKSRQRVQNLGFFDMVDIAPHPREGDIIDIDVEVKERLTGMISFGVGYSTEDKLTGQIRISESNLFGRGQNAAIMFERSSVATNYSFSFNEPVLLDSQYSLGFSIYNMLRSYTDYDQKDVGGKLSFGRSLGGRFSNIRATTTITHETLTVNNVKLTASDYIKAQVGTATTNSVQLTLVSDSRDNFFNPTTGSRTLLSGEYAGGALGGDNDFTRFQAESSIYRPLLWKLVGMLHGQYGTVQGFNGKEPPIYEKFFLGGITTLRGFPYRMVGPLDEKGEPKGGYQELFFNGEVIVPVAPEQGFNLVFFYDTGNAWDKGQNVDLGELRHSVGAGIRWMSPMGPFRLEWGYVVDHKEGEARSDWAFTIGNFF
jgi:outer membrane protein insertion porin family